MTGFRHPISAAEQATGLKGPLLGLCILRLLITFEQALQIFFFLGPHKLYSWSAFNVLGTNVFFFQYVKLNIKGLFLTLSLPFLSNRPQKAWNHDLKITKDLFYMKAIEFPE